MRAHLVAVRGGALFLSSSDATHLMEWLDRGVPVCHILRAIERAAEARRKRQSRLPLTLGQVKRHLGKPTRGAFSGQAVPSATTPLAPLVERIVAAVDGDPQGARLAALAEAFRCIPNGPPAEMGRTAAERLRTFHVGVWESLSESEREAHRLRERTQLGDLQHLLDEVALAAIVEENAREAARSRYGWLSVATVWDLLEAWNPEVR